MAVHETENGSLTVELWLHGKPEMDFDEDEEITPEAIHTHADEMSKHLHRVGDILAILRDDGWSFSLFGYSVALFHEGVTTARQARARLRKLGLNVKEFMIQEG